MRINVLRGACAFVVALTLALPALAQSVVRGKVTDAQGKPIQDATVVFEAQDANRKMQTKTDGKGEFLQVGLQSGSYKVTASKDGVGTQTLNSNVRQGPNQPLSFSLSASSNMTNADKQAAVALQAAAGAALDAMKAGKNDEAIAKFQEVLAKLPTCSDCYYNMGVAYSNKQQYAEAEGAFKKVIELKPDSADAYTGLANLYNSQKKFDLAAEASNKAQQLAGAAGGAGGGAEATYNQGVILWNAGKYAEAKDQFESAVKSDPNMSMAHYQLGMANLNLGKIPEARAAFEGYLKADPNGPKAAEVKTFLAQLPK